MSVDRKLTFVCYINSRGNFPYEELEDFYDIWSPEPVQEMFTIMDGLDTLSGIEVRKRESEIYSQRIRKADVIIDCEDDHLTENKYFLTFSKNGDGIFELERDLQAPEKFVYSITTKGDQKLGISTIIDDFGKQLQRWEGAATATKKEVNDDEDRTESGESDQSFEKSNPENDIGDFKTLDWKNGICVEQKKLWKKRTKEFSNYDRIALFQFNIDNTYYPPSTETCLWWNTDKESEKIAPSCAEFRRRKILKEVLVACDLFKVEILLLPEYSVRPETVEWMAEQIENNGYEFAVWAGTFRIPVGHTFEPKSYWKDADTLKGRDHYHAAVLPVIVPESRIGGA